MTLPTKDKTWQIQSNIQSYLDPGLNATTLNKNAIRALRDALLAPALFPWIVESSCDSLAFGNNDQDDKWIDNDDIVPKTAGTAHSWMVLKQPGMGGEASLCIDFNDASSQAHQAQFTFSPNAGYGSANGGADGTTLDRPTATDEIELNSQGSDWGPGTTSYIQSAMNVWVSTDGEVTRIAMMYARRADMVFILEVPKNPIPEWDPAVIAGHDQSSSGWVRTRWAGLATASTRTQFRQTGVGIGTLTHSGAGTSNNVSADRSEAQATADVDGGAIMTPIMLVSETSTPLLRGIWGTVFDLYHCPLNFVPGEMIKDDDGNIQWVNLGNYWLPWSNAAGQLVVS